MNLVVIHLRGTVGKTTIAKHLIAPMLVDPMRIQIESINDSANGANVEITAAQFRYLAEQMASHQKNRVIDIGGSNVESVLQQMSQMDGVQEDIDWWIVPVDARAMVIVDTLKTIQWLINNLCVDPRRIVVIANNVDPEALRNWDQRFQPISDGAARGGFTFVSVPVLQSDLFDLIKSETASVHDLAADDTDLRAQCAAEADSSKREAIGRKIVHRRMARSLSRNLQDVWKASPLAAAVQSVAA